MSAATWASPARVSARSWLQSSLGGKAATPDTLGKPPPLRRTRRERPCYSDGWVVLPEPMRCIITLPEGDDPRAGRVYTPSRTFFGFVEARRLKVRGGTVDRAVFVRLMTARRSARLV